MSEPTAKLLCLCDSPTLQTGFGRVAQNLFSRWAAAKVFKEIWVWGIGYNGFPHSLPYHICPADLKEMPAWHDPRNFRRFLLALKSTAMTANGTSGFTHVWILQDIHGVNTLTNREYFDGKNGMPESLRPLCAEFGIKSFLYFPVDAEMEPEWMRIVADVDVPVAYCEYGREEAVKALQVGVAGEPQGPRVKAISRIQIQPHGVNREIYRKVAEGAPDHKWAARAKMFGGKVAPEDFLMVCVAQNQKRKALWHTLELLRTIKALRPDLRPKMYIHANSENADENINLKTVANQMGLEGGKELFFGDAMLKRGYALVDEYNLNAIYNAADVLVSTSFGEGWGLPLTEAMAAGTAVAGPAHSSVAELLGDDRGILFNTAGHQVVVGDNSRLRPCTDILDAAQKLITARVLAPEEQGSLASFAARGEAWARSEYLDWDRIANEWLKLFGLASTETE